MKPLVAFLHGFLGQGSDWSPWAQRFDTSWCPDLLRAGPLDPRCPLADWGERFNRQAGARGRPCLLVGYSLGGRLALHALASPASPWQAGLLISAHPGLSDSAQILARRAWDARWAARFRDEAWPDVLGDWNALPVFSGSKPRPHDPAMLDRSLLARALERWSPTGHRFSLQTMQARRLWWCSGAQDHRYAALYAGLPDYPLWQQICLPGAGHRLPWDRPEAFGQLLDEVWQAVR